MRKPVVISTLVLLAALACPLTTAAQAAAAPPGPSGTGPAAPTQLKPIQAVILADESGSESPTDIGYEQAAAISLFNGELSPRSEFSVLGFGSSNGPGETAVDIYCPFITVDNAIDRARLTSCASQIKARTHAQGWDTDHEAALEQAVYQLTRPGPAGMTKIIFLMTDGVLDVSNSPQYGPPAVRNRNALLLIEHQTLPAAYRAGIQIWPLGFGSEIGQMGPAGYTGKQLLAMYAQGGAGASSQCPGENAATPHDTIVQSSAYLAASLLAELSKARCAAPPKVVTVPVTPMRPVKLSVTIPPIATDGMIEVDKSNPQFQVAYYGPGGQRAPAAGQQDGQTFTLVGIGQPVESMHIADPLPGNWEVVVTDPPGVRAGHVTLEAVWGGALEGTVNAVPAQPTAGSGWDIQMQVLSRSGFVTSAAALQDVTATVRIAGSFGERTTRLSLGTHPANGMFSGTVALPADAHGYVEACGRISGAGLAADRRCLSSMVLPATGWKKITVIVKFPTGNTVHPGGYLTGQVKISNGLAAQTGTLALGELGPNEQVTVSPAQVPMPVGQSSFNFSLRFAPGTARGYAGGAIDVMDQAGTLVGDTTIGVTVVPAPGLLSQIWWVLVLAVLLVLAALLAAYSWQRRPDPADVRGLVARLAWADGKLGPTAVRGRKGRQLDLVVVMDPDRARTRIRRGNPGESNVTVRRDGSHLLVEGKNLPLRTAETGRLVPIEGDFGIIVNDEQRHKGRRAPTGSPRAKTATPPSRTPLYDP
jgi:hypothetical protein